MRWPARQLPPAPCYVGNKGRREPKQGNKQNRNTKLDKNDQNKGNGTNTAKQKEQIKLSSWVNLLPTSGGAVQPRSSDLRRPKQVTKPLGNPITEILQAIRNTKRGLRNEETPKTRSQTRKNKNKTGREAAAIVNIIPQAILAQEPLPREQDKQNRSQIKSKIREALSNTEWKHNETTKIQYGTEVK